MIDRDKFNRILKQQKNGPKAPIEHGPLPTGGAPSKTASQRSEEAAPGPKAPSLKDLLGQKVTLHGTARDASLGAVVLRDNGTPVYLEGLDCWDAGTSHKRIAVTGTLVKKKLAPDPEVGPDGGISHGAFGTDWVLENPAWVLESP